MLHISWWLCNTYEKYNNVTFFVWTANNAYEQCNNFYIFGNNCKQCIYRNNVTPRTKNVTNCYVFRRCCSFCSKNLSEITTRVPRWNPVFYWERLLVRSMRKQHIMSMHIRRNIFKKKSSIKSLRTSIGPSVA